MVSTHCDQRALMRLGHPRVGLPAPAVALDLIAALRRVRADPRRRLEGTPADVQGEGHAKAVGELADAPVASARAVFKMAFQAQVRRALDRLHRFVDGLVALVAGREEQFGALLNVQHDRDRDARAVRPADTRILICIALEIPSHALALAPNALAAFCPCTRIASLLVQTGRPLPTTICLFTIPRATSRPGPVCTSASVGCTAEQRKAKTPRSPFLPAASEPIPPQPAKIARLEACTPGHPWRGLLYPQRAARSGAAR